jgi:hypothetical protein
MKFVLDHGDRSISMLVEVIDPFFVISRIYAGSPRMK